MRSSKYLSISKKRKLYCIFIIHAFHSSSCANCEGEMLIQLHDDDENLWFATYRIILCYAQREENKKLI